MNLPAQSCNVSKDFLPVTARSVATRQSHCKRLLRFARNDPLYDDWFLGSGHAITLKYNNYRSKKELFLPPLSSFLMPKLAI
jgi:hypothetical protein